MAKAVRESSSLLSDSTLPEGWIDMPLASVLSTLESGSRPKGGVWGIKNGIVSIGGEHIDESGGFRFDRIKFVPREFYERMTHGRIQLGDILIVKDGATTGKVALVRDGFAYNPAVVNEHVFVCRPCEAIYPPFLFYFLFSSIGQSRIRENFQGSAQGGINQRFARKTIVPVAPRAEQERIVGKVDELLANIMVVLDRLVRVRAILRRFRQAVLAVAASGDLVADLHPAQEGGQDDSFLSIWESTTLGTLIKEGPQNGIYKPLSEYGTGIPIVRIDDFQDGTVKPREDLFLVKVTADEAEKFGLKFNDILLNRVNSPSRLGKSLLVPENLCPAVFESNMMRFSVSESADPAWVALYLRSPQGKGHLTRNAKWAVNQASINQTDVEATPIPLPPLGEQSEIVRRADVLFQLADAIEKRVKAGIARANSLTEAILVRAFEGGLVPPEAELARGEGRSYEPVSVSVARHMKSDSSSFKKHSAREGNGRSRRTAKRRGAF